MKTRSDVRDFRQKWLDKCEEYNQNFKKLGDALMQNHYAANEEISNLIKDHDDLWKDVQRTLEDYHNAYDEYAENLTQSVDPCIKEYVSSVIEQHKLNTHDWAQKIDDDFEFIEKFISAVGNYQKAVILDPNNITEKKELLSNAFSDIKICENSSSSFSQRISPNGIKVAIIEELNKLK